MNDSYKKMSIKGRFKKNVYKRYILAIFLLGHFLQTRKIKYINDFFEKLDNRMDLDSVVLLLVKIMAQLPRMSVA
jgi:hypothetical protein